MVRGGPGSGKTLLGLHFLRAGVDAGETALYITFEESAESIRADAAAVGTDTDGIRFLDLSPEAGYFAEDRGYDLFEPDEVEASEVTDTIVAAVDEAAPDRVFVDPLNQLRHLSRDDYAFWKEVAAFMTYLRESGATVLFSTETTPASPDDELQFLSDGTLKVGHSEKGRTFSVSKFRASGFESGDHTMRITDEGMSVFPRLRPETHERTFDAETLSSGVDDLDALLQGGIERGTVTILSGPSGVGKTTTGSHFMKEAATRDERSVIYMFEESVDTFLHRSESIGIPVAEMRDRGTLAIEAVEPLALSPDEFANQVREEAEERGASVVMIDGISGYRLSIRGDEDDLVRELHALCRYLTGLGVTVVLVDDVDAVTGDFRPTSRNISYLADNILFLRYIEVRGEIRKAMGVLKKRASDFERTLRAFDITSEGLQVGEPLTGLRGILSGSPDWPPDADE